MTGKYTVAKMVTDGGVAYGVSGLRIQVHLDLKCRLRHLHHPMGRPGWCR
jgi:hypothetical protein